VNVLPDETVKFGWGQLPALFPGIPGHERWLPLLKRHAEVVEEAAPRVRVTAVAADEVVRRHYAESLELWRIVLERHGEPRVLVDVGSGGGFPGLVIAAVAPQVETHLVEPLQKRARLLEEMVRELELSNVTVHPIRAEEAGRGPLRDAAEVVTARAVAELRELLEYTAPLAAPGALLAFPKGSGLDAEIEAAQHAMEVLGAEMAGIEPMRPEVSETLRVVTFRKTGPTPAAYPRRPGIPGKRPL